MSSRATFEFVVRTDPGAGDKKWLGYEGEVDDERQALVFRFHRSPMIRERVLMERLLYKYAGGFEAWRQLTAEINAAEREIAAAAAAALWPGGRPAVADLDEVRRQDAELAVATGKVDHPLKPEWETLQDMLDRLTFMATWEVLIVDPPRGWASIADRELDNDQLGWISAAYFRAWTESSRPNVQSSKSSTAA